MTEALGSLATLKEFLSDDIAKGILERTIAILREKC